MNPRLSISRSAIRDFCRAHGVRKLAVFGSALREDFAPESDVDVLIDLDPGTRIGLVAFQRMSDELAVLFGRPVDLLTKNGINRHIREDILRQAQVLYEE